MNVLPSDIVRLIVDNIESVEALELLLLLHREPQRAWTAADVAREARTNEWSALMHLEHLTERKLLTALGGAPAQFQADRSAAPAAMRLTHAYQHFRVAVITQIYSKPDEVAELDPAQAFADAFKLKRGK